MVRRCHLLLIFSLHHLISSLHSNDEMSGLVSQNFLFCQQLSSILELIAFILHLVQAWRFQSSNSMLHLMLVSMYIHFLIQLSMHFPARSESPFYQMDFVLILSNMACISAELRVGKECVSTRRSRV